MLISTIFPLCAIPFSILILIIFYKKGYVNNTETKIYKNLIILNFIGLILEILCAIASIFINYIPNVSNFIYKSYLIYLLSWTAVMLHYIYKISTNEIKKNRKSFIYIISLVVICITYILPIELVTGNVFGIKYTTGPSVNFCYIISCCIGI